MHNTPYNTHTMAYLSNIAYDRYHRLATYPRGANGSCFPTAVAALTHGDSEKSCDLLVDARLYNKRRGGTHVQWRSVSDACRIAAPGYEFMDITCHVYDRKRPTLTQYVRTLSDGCYIIIKRAHAFGVIIYDGFAYCIDYGEKNSRSQVWTCTKVVGADPVKMLRKAQGKAEVIVEFAKDEKGQYLLF